MIKVGIIGAGIIAREHAVAVTQTGGRTKLMAVADMSPLRLAEFCKEFGIDSRYAVASDLIADPDIDLVIVATPPSTHETLTVAALDAGKFVLCEKPLAHSLASARRIEEAEGRNPGKLSVGYQLRYDPEFRRLAWLVGKGWLGNLTSVTLERHGTTPTTNAGRPDWWGSWGMAGGGVLLTQMIHEVDLLIQLMGMPKSVSATADTRFCDIESEDFIEADLTFGDGRTAWCVGSVNSGVQVGGFAVHGENGDAILGGRLNLFDPAQQAQALRSVKAEVPLSKGMAVPAPLASIGRRLGLSPKRLPSPHTLLLLDIADAIENGRPMPIPAKDAMQSLELCMAIYESANTGSQVNLPISQDSPIYSGVQIGDYRRRSCDRNRDGVFLPPLAMIAPDTALHHLKQLAKAVLGAVGLETAVIKSKLRKPADVHGAPPTRIRSWPRRQNFGRTEKRALVRLLNREMREGNAVRYDGPEEQLYCQEFASYLGGGYADAVNSGTNAVYVALRALDLEPGSEVIVAPVTDAGGTMPVALLNCIPKVADAAPGSILVSADQIREVLTERTSAILIAHIAGHAVDMDPILALAHERGLPVVEDCAQAHGTLYKGRMVGTFGDIAAFSTMYLKNHATGGQGGVVFTRNPRLHIRARQAADRGKPIGVLPPRGNVMASLNLNQDEISMAIGREQLKKLPRQVTARRAFAAIVEAGLADVDGASVIGDPSWGTSSYHFLMIRLDVDSLGCTIEQFVAGLQQDGITAADVYKVFPTENPWYCNAQVFGSSGMPWSLVQDNAEPQRFDLTNAHEATRTLLRIDLHDGVGAREAHDVVRAVTKGVAWYRARSRKS